VTDIKRGGRPAKNLQVRLGTQAHERLTEIADQLGGKTISDVIRESIELMAICIAYHRARKPLMWIDPETGVRTQVLIPGLHTVESNLVVPTAATETEH
jgi:hypothetical protein